MSSLSTSKKGKIAKLYNGGRLVGWCSESRKMHAISEYTYLEKKINGLITGLIRHIFLKRDSVFSNLAEENARLPRA